MSEEAKTCVKLNDGLLRLMESYQNGSTIEEEKKAAKTHMQIIRHNDDTESLEDIPGFRFDTMVQRTKIEKLDLDYECKKDFLNGKGVLITSSDAYDKKGEKIYNGLQSPFFGTDYGDEAAFADRYTCLCGKYVGKYYLGMLCDNCKSVVTHDEVDVSKTGWIVLDHFKVISPIFYKKLEKALGNFEGNESVLSRILRGRYTSKMKDEFDDKDRANLSKHPFSKKGMIWFSENILEVLDFYQKKKPAKAELFNEIRDEIDKVFCHCIPIYSAVMRIETPSKKGEKLYKDKINTIYDSIINSVNTINDFGDPSQMEEYEFHSVDRHLKSIQDELSGAPDNKNAFDVVFMTIDGKKGEIQGKVVAGRYNFSARTIIVAGSGRLRADEIELPYSVFLELFRYELIDAYHEQYGCPIMRATDKWKWAKSHFDPDFYEIMQHYVTDEKYAPFVGIIVNRNPSINYGAFLDMIVKNVKPSIADKTMTINTRVIKTLGADFDGDQMNIFRVPGARLVRKFRKSMSPTKNLFVNRLDGHVNRDMLNIKDEVIVYQAFMNKE
jgi:DNA-directed RNA polymerase beta' subunit